MKSISSQIHDTMIHSLLRIMNYKKKKKIIFLGIQNMLIVRIHNCIA